MIDGSPEKVNDLREVLEQYGISFDRLGIYEFASTALRWFSDEFKTNVEIELRKDDEDKRCSFQVLLVPDVEGIVERTVVLACTTDAETMPKEMFVAKAVRKHIIPDVKGLEYSERHNAYLVTDSEVFILTIKRLLEKLPTKEPSYVG
jgi:hypothetical protein